MSRDEVHAALGDPFQSLRKVRALGVDAEAWLAMSAGHGSIARIRIQPDGSFKIIAVGDVGHLPPNLLTGATGDPDRSLAIPALPGAAGK